MSNESGVCKKWEPPGLESLSNLMNFRPFVGRSVGDLSRWFFVSKALPSPEEAQEKRRRQLQGLGISGEGDPCGWPGIRCSECAVTRGIRSSECEVKEVRCTKAVGDLNSVKEMTGLVILELQGQVTGNLTELSQLNALYRVDLSNTKVRGNLSEVSKLKKLQYLHLSNTQVVGDVSWVSELTALQYLHLSNTQVVGNISELSKLKALRYLDLSQTDVVGEIGVIRKMPRLENVVLSRTAVSGDLEDLVSGDLEDLLRGKWCARLSELHLGVSALVFVVWFYHVKSGFGVLQFLVLRCLVRTHKSGFHLALLPVPGSGIAGPERYCFQCCNFSTPAA